MLKLQLSLVALEFENPFWHFLLQVVLRQMAENHLSCLVILVAPDNLIVKLLLHLITMDLKLDILNSLLQFDS